VTSWYSMGDVGARVDDVMWKDDDITEGLVDVIRVWVNEVMRV
jgi:hypothetical protein